MTQPAPLALVSIAQLTRKGDWQLALGHDRPCHMLFWMTRGQTVGLIDGARRGVGVHNALFVPARHLFALEPARQSFGQALVIPDDLGLPLPTQVQHLRIRDVAAQSELNVLLEALGREQGSQRPDSSAAMRCYAELVAIWLQRQLIEGDHPPPKEDAARRLMRAYTAQIVADYASGATMADHAARLGVTPTHLSRVCKSETGRTAADLLAERVLYAARSLLVDSTLPIQDIARSVGIGSPAYFTRFLQRHTGRTPSALRRAAAA